MNKLSSDSYLHPLPGQAIGIPLPVRFTYPFHYTPHPLVRLAAEEVLHYLSTRNEWQEELQQGKMFGVLIVQQADGSCGYLAAFSGNLAGSNLHPFFVPPVYDLLQPDGFFRIEEANISAINRQIRELESSPEYQSCEAALRDARNSAGQELERARQELKNARALREARRREPLTPEEQEALIRESQFQKAEYKRLEKRLKDQLLHLQEKADQYRERLEQMKQERKSRSARLQKELFGQFHMLNARGESKDLCELFRDTPQGTPPAGTGECALPKLLQYAYLHQLKPLAMGEFWWGNSPKNEIRRHGHFYPSCSGKCAPILKHMLIGLEVDPNPLVENRHHDTPLEIIYEDPWIVVVNKPAGMLSVPGKNGLDSVLQRLQELYPESDSPLLVHRLDMDTSGLLLAAKDKNIHQYLQALFETRQIRKRYTALLQGTPRQDEGTIDLPLCPDFSDRPRQQVNWELGKKAVTRFRVEERSGGTTRVSFWPLTGRTHQLRVHAAHPEGLDSPILGDPLYGNQADRLYLHATELEFTHPVTGKTIHLCKEAPF